MDAEQFVRAIDTAVRQAAIKATLQALTDPGFLPNSSEAKMVRWFNGLSSVDRDGVLAAIEMSADMATFGIFTVLDHVRFVEDEPDKDTFELYYVKNENRVLLNDWTRNPLHDIYSAIRKE